MGVVERDKIIDGSRICAGDALLALRSSGPHSNGYSLIRKVLDISGDCEVGGIPAAEALLSPTRIYVRPVLELLRRVDVRGLAHITGGGIAENLPRIHEPSLHAEIDTKSWHQGPLFDWLAEGGNIDVAEMRRTFNCGVGMIIAVDEDSAVDAVTVLEDQGEDAWIIGRMADGPGEVSFL